MACRFCRLIRHHLFSPLVSQIEVSSSCFQTTSNLTAFKTRFKPLGSYYDHNSLVYPGLVPVFIKEIVQKLEENSHLETEGLYRVPADRKKRRELLEYFDSSYKIGGRII